MKKSLILGILLCVSFLVSCAAEESKADGPEGVELISEKQLSVGRILEYRHIKTGCHYMIVTGDGKAVTQMHGKDGLPYCD